MSRKINPRRRPATQADVQRAKDAGNIYPNTVCAECWEKGLETTKEAE